MVYNIIPLIIIIVCLIIIIFIIGRRFSQLATIDLDSIAQERDEKVKNKIIIERLSRKWLFLKTKIIFILKPLFDKLVLVCRGLYERIMKLEAEYKKESLSEIGKNDFEKEEIKSLFDKARELSKQENYNEAEKDYIKIIELDNKNLIAYQELGEIYLQKKDYKLAKETFQYILKLLKSQPIDNNGNALRLALCFFNLGRVYQQLGQNKSALVNFNKALKLEPSNPRYLDQTLEISIILKDKKKAEEIMEIFKKVNSENQKIAELEEKIKGL